MFCQDSRVCYLVSSFVEYRDGHFVAYVKQKQNVTWMKCDDSVVTCLEGGVSSIWPRLIFLEKMRRQPPLRAVESSSQVKFLSRLPELLESVVTGSGRCGWERRVSARVERSATESQTGVKIDAASVRRAVKRLKKRRLEVRKNRKDTRGKRQPRKDRQDMRKNRKYTRGKRQPRKDREDIFFSLSHQSLFLSCDHHCLSHQLALDQLSFLCQVSFCQLSFLWLLATAGALFVAGARLVAGALLVDPGFLGSGMGAAGVVGVADVGAADLGVAGVVVFAGVDAAGVVGVAVCAADLGVAGMVAAGVVVFAGVDAAGVVGVAVLDAADAAGGYCGLAFGGCGKPRFAFAFGSSFATSGFVAAFLELE